MSGVEDTAWSGPNKTSTSEYVQYSKQPLATPPSWHPDRCVSSVDDLPAYFRFEAACYRLEYYRRTARERQYRRNRNAQLRRREGKGAC